MIEIQIGEYPGPVEPRLFYVEKTNYSISYEGGRIRIDGYPETIYPSYIWSVEFRTLNEFETKEAKERLEKERLIEEAKEKKVKEEQEFLESVKAKLSKKELRVLKGSFKKEKG